jgi:Cu+-exporting ATPase
MDQRTDGGKVYFCPMHSDVGQSKPGKCPRCGMALLPEGDALRPAAAHDQQSVAPCRHGGRDGRADGGSHDDATDRSA